jgi:hypothetical protein
MTDCSNLKDTVAGFKSGTSLGNPEFTAITQSLSSTINTLSGLAPGGSDPLSAPFEAMLSSVTATFTGAQTAMTNYLNRLYVSLPMMNAADNTAKLISAANNVLPAAGMGAEFKATLQDPLTDMTTHLTEWNTSIQSALSGSVASIISDVTSSVNAAQGAISSTLSAAAAAEASAIGTLKSYAFSKFCAAPQTAHVSSIIFQTTNNNPPCPDIIQVGTSTGAAIVASTYGPVPQINVARDVDAPRPGVPPQVDTPLVDPNPDNVCGIGFLAWDESYQAHVHQILVDANAAYDRAEAYSPSMEAWKAANYPNPTYAEIRLDATNHPTDTAKQDAYVAARANLRTNWPDYTAWKREADANKTLNVEYNRLKAQRIRWLQSGNGYEEIEAHSIISRALECDPSKW